MRFGQGHNEGEAASSSSHVVGQVEGESRAPGRGAVVVLCGGTRWVRTTGKGTYRSRVTRTRAIPYAGASHTKYRASDSLNRAHHNKQIARITTNKLREYCAFAAPYATAFACLLPSPSLSGILLRLGTPYSVLKDLAVFPFLSLSYQINFSQPRCPYVSLFFSHHAACTPHSFHLRAVHGYALLLFSSILPPPCGCRILSMSLK